MPDVWNYLSSTARTVMPTQYIPANVFTLVIEYYTGEIEKVMFQLPPEQITESKGANFAADHVLGRFEPIRMYTNSDATRINFTVNFYWMEDNLTNNSVGTWNGIRDNVLKLRALLYPYDSGRASSGPGTMTLQTISQQSANAGQGGQDDMPDTSAYNQYVGKLSPPPGIKLYYGDLYRGLPCILAGITMDFKGPWNDASLASVARRLANSVSSSFSSGVARAFDSANQILTPIAGIVQALPSNILGDKATLLNNLTSFFRQDKLFPFQTTVNLSLETMYPYATQKTFSDIRTAGVYGASSKPVLSKVIDNLPASIGGIFR